MGGWPGSRKTTSSAIKLNTLSMSPALVALIQVATSWRISCSSLCMFPPLPTPSAEDQPPFSDVG
jgi:hypothetical protein